MVWEGVLAYAYVRGVLQAVHLDNHQFGPPVAQIFIYMRALSDGVSCVGFAASGVFGHIHRSGWAIGVSDRCRGGRRGGRAEDAPGRPRADGETKRAGSPSRPGRAGTGRDRAGATPDGGPDRSGPPMPAVRTRSLPTAAGGIRFPPTGRPESTAEPPGGGTAAAPVTGARRPTARVPPSRAEPTGPGRERPGRARRPGPGGSWTRDESWHAE